MFVAFFFCGIDFVVLVISFGGSLMSDGGCFYNLADDKKNYNFIISNRNGRDKNIAVNNLKFEQKKQRNTKFDRRGML